MILRTFEVGGFRKVELELRLDEAKQRRKDRGNNLNQMHIWTLDQMEAFFASTLIDSTAREITSDAAVNHETEKHLCRQAINGSLQKKLQEAIGIAINHISTR